MPAQTGVKLLFWRHWRVGFPKTHVASLLWLLCSFPTCLPRSGENGWDGGELSIDPVLAGIQRGIYLVPSLLGRLCQCPINTQHLQELELGSLPVLTRWVLWVGWFGPLAGEEGEEEGHSWENCGWMNIFLTAPPRSSSSRHEVRPQCLLQVVWGMSSWPGVTVPTPKALGGKRGAAGVACTGIGRVAKETSQRCRGESIE